MSVVSIVQCGRTHRCTIDFYSLIAPQPGGCQCPRESYFENISSTQIYPFTCRSGFDGILLPSCPFGCGTTNISSKRSRQSESSRLWSNQSFNHRSRQCEFATTSTLETLLRSRFSSYPGPGPGTLWPLLSSPRVPLRSATYLSHAPVHSVWFWYIPSHAVPPILSNSTPFPPFPPPFCPNCTF